jgi:SAM-dependent methyltransferase
MIRAENRIDSAASPGAAWVERFLLPQFARRFSKDRSVSCLQIAPDDDSEARRLCQLGHNCEMTTPTADLELPFPEASYDFVFTGRFPVLAPELEARITLAKELYRVTRRGGALLLAMGNRSSPLDLTGNGPLLHGTRARHCLSVQEARAILVRAAGFESLVPLSVSGHFGWNRLPRLLQPLGQILDVYWRFVATPNRLWLYSSPLNPTLLLWLNRN